MEIKETDRDIVQIKADRAEVNRRIEAFICRKRSEVDQLNLQEFCNRSYPVPESESSCARADAIVVHRSDGKAGHLKVSRVVNQWGPLVGNQAKDSGSSNQGPSATPIEERVRNMETHLNIKSGETSTKDIYARLKTLEDRILYLEGISPEYFNHMGHRKRGRMAADTPFNSGSARFSQKGNADTVPREIGMRLRALRQALHRQRRRLSTQ